MKARLPEGHSKGGAANLQQSARQAQKLQEEVGKAITELETKEYIATSGESAVEVVATGGTELKSITIRPEVMDPEGVKMPSDLTLTITNGALRTVVVGKSERVEALSGGLSVPGTF